MSPWQKVTTKVGCAPHVEEATKVTLPATAHDATPKVVEPERVASRFPQDLASYKDFSNPHN